MTKREIKTTIKNMRATQKEKDILQRQCDEGDRGALFATYALKLRQAKK